MHIPTSLVITVLLTFPAAVVAGEKKEKESSIIRVEKSGLTGSVVTYSDPTGNVLACYVIGGNNNLALAPKICALQAQWEQQNIVTE